MKRFFPLFLTAFFLFTVIPISEAASAPRRQIRIRAMWSGKRRFLNLSDIAAFYQLRYHNNPGYCAIYGRVHNAVFVHRRRTGSINGTGVTWTAAPIIRGNDVYIADDDFFKMIDSVFRPFTIPRKNVRTILLDPGHGGTDQGAPSILKGRCEKTVNLQIALKLRSFLAARGYKVYLTRASDKTVTLAQRVAMAEKLKPDLFVSIHCNAASNTGVSGIETFAATPVGVPGSSDTKLNTEPASGNLFDKQNFLLAYDIQAQLKRTTGLTDRGVKHARYYVIRHAPCPAVLIETGFISNQRDARILFSVNGQNALAGAIARGIVRYTESME